MPQVRLREALNASRSHPLARTLTASQFGSGLLRAKTPDGTRRPGSRGRASPRERTELETAHDQMVSLGRAWATDTTGLPSMESLRAVAPKLLHKRKEVGAYGMSSNSMLSRVEELEALVAELRHMIAIRDKELARLRVRLSMLQMKNEALEAEIRRLQEIIAALESRASELEALIAKQAAELAELRAWKLAKENEWKPTFADAVSLAAAPMHDQAQQTLSSFPQVELERLRSMTKLQEHKLEMVPHPAPLPPNTS